MADKLISKIKIPNSNDTYKIKDSSAVSNVSWDTTNKKLTKTINGTTTDIVTSATILGNLTSSQVTTALGYTPYNSTNPNGYTSNTGTVISVATDGGLTGGTITSSGTLKANLKSFTKLTNNSVKATETSGRVYPVELDKTGYLAVNVPWTDHYAWGDITGKPSSFTPSSHTHTKSEITDFPTLGTAAAKNYTTSVTQNSSDLVTSGAVYTAIDNLPEPMVFKGSLGTGGTITDLPTDGTASIGDTYKVITAKTYAGKSAEIGDTFICLTKTSSANTWELIPSGDEPSGTVISVGIDIASGAPLSVVSGSPITDSGTITLTHSNSGATAGSYGDSSAQTPTYGGTFKVPYVTVNATGHITSISDHTVKIPASDNTTYKFTNGTNGFTVTPSGGTAQTVTVTPSIANNITGSGTSGYIAKFNGANTITNGPAFGSTTTTYLNNAGNWATPPDTKNTAGSTDTSSKIFLVGATSQAANPQTYSDNEVYVTSGVLTTKKVQIGGTAATMEYNTTTESIDFIFN